MKVYIVNGSREYTEFFQKIGFGIARNIDDSQLVCFTGGEDVTPSLYGDYQHSQTWNSEARDASELHMLHKAQELGIPCVGICRGGQFLNVASGGRMYQHVTGHTRSHELVDILTGSIIYVSSTHHQMMMPSDKGTVVAVSKDVDSYREWYDGHIAEHDFNEEGIEVVYYEHTNSLCFQPHPEFSVYDDDYEAMSQYFKGLVFSLLIKETV